MKSFRFYSCVDVGRFIGAPYPVAGGPSMEDDPMCYVSGLLASLLPLSLRNTGSGAAA